MTYEAVSFSLFFSDFLEEFIESPVTRISYPIEAHLDIFLRLVIPVIIIGRDLDIQAPDGPIFVVEEARRIASPGENKGVVVTLHFFPCG